MVNELGIQKHSATNKELFELLVGKRLDAIILRLFRLDKPSQPLNFVSQLLQGQMGLLDHDHGVLEHVHGSIGTFVRSQHF